MSERAVFPAPCRGKAYILGADQRFAEAIAHELNRMGVIVTVVTDASIPLWDIKEDATLIVADGDALSAEEWERIRHRTTCPWLVWSREGIMLPWAVCLHRPFDLVDFVGAVEACLAEGDVPVPMPSSVAAAWPVRSPKERDSVRPLRDGVLVVGREEVTLTPYEWAVYRCLSRHRGETVSRETLRAALDGAGGNTVDVYVCHLRAKLEKPLGVRLITTVRGKGYRME